MKQIKYHLEYKPVLSFTMVDVPNEPIIHEIQPFMFSSEQMKAIEDYIIAMNKYADEYMNTLLIPSKHLQK